MHKSSSGAVYSLKVHLVILTKYRYKVIDQALHQRLEEIFRQTCAKWDCQVQEFNTEADHLHALLDLNPKVTPYKLVNNLKTVSSRLIRKEFGDYLSKFYSKPVLWSIGYAINSCGHGCATCGRTVSCPRGGATLEKIKDYIHNQGA